MKKILYILIAIGAVLRLYQFGALPRALNRDEAALGYNAFAILQSGIDEWGQRLPLTFKSFGDYKLPGYIYTLVFFIQILGVNEISIRLPSLLAGLALIPLTYLLAKKLTHDKEKALWAAVFIALSPWSIFYSRVAFEANLALAFFLGSLLCLHERSLGKVMCGLVLYTLAIATYNTPLMLLPLVLLIVVIKKAPVWQKIGESLMIVCISIGWLFIIQDIITQKAGITIFNDPTIVSQQSTLKMNAATVIEKIRYSKHVYEISLILNNSIKSVSPSFMLFNGGSNPWHQIPHSGVVSKTAYVLALIAFIEVLLMKNKKARIIALLFLGGLAPSLITVDAPHVTRSLFALVLINILAVTVVPTTKKIITGLLTIALVVETSAYAVNYFGNFPETHDSKWQVGLRESIYASREKYPNTIINITNPQSQPYIYVLLYEKVKPEDFVESVVYYGKDSSGLEYVKSFTGWSFIGDPKDVSDGIPIIHQDQQGGYSLK